VEPVFPLARQATGASQPATIYHVGLSGGKDSTALWGWMLNESAYDPRQVRGSFADTENEYPEVYEQIAKLSRYGVERGAPPVRTLPSIGFFNLAKLKKRFPSARARFCTELLKMYPCRKYIEELWLDGHEVIGLSGVRANESDERAQLSECGWDGYLQVAIQRPLLQWTIQQVWAAHQRYGLPINPLYFQGRRRVGCRLCCMSNKRDIRTTALQRPEVIDEYRRWEAELAVIREGMPMTFFHASTVTKQFRSVKFTNKKGETFDVATIDDAVRWSMTEHGGKQFPLAFMYDMDDEEEDLDGGLSCKSAMGHCE
jgi:3'-phosphoadenosine 5'-phosphosulfate sulfotransferase (PAPS reductase)/FAD synthetase